jgi:hypothetical protein
MWCALELLDRLKCEFEVKTTKESGVGAHSLLRNILGGGGWRGMPKLQDGTRKNEKHLFTPIDLHTKPNNKLVSALLQHFWC